MPTVNVREFGRLFEYSHPRVSDMISQGMPAGPPAKGRGGRQIHLRAALDWLIRQAVDKVKISADGLLSDIHAGADYRAHLIGVMARRAVAAA